jgi:hypothetical protein
VKNLFVVLEGSVEELSFDGVHCSEVFDYVGDFLGLLEVPLGPSSSFGWSFAVSGEVSGLVAIEAFGGLFAVSGEMSHLIACGTIRPPFLA